MRDIIQKPVDRARIVGVEMQVAVHNAKQLHNHGKDTSFDCVLLFALRIQRVKRFQFLQARGDIFELRHFNGYLQNAVWLG